MSHEKSDALVFFGATGDLAHKKIFPALQALARRGHLDIPVIGVAKSGWTRDQLEARARDSVERYGGLDPDAFARLIRALHYIDGDYADPGTFKRLRQELGDARHPTHYLAIPRASSRPSSISSASRGARPVDASWSRSRSVRTWPRRADWNAAVQWALRRSQRVPHRSLSGQEHRSEPALLPLRQLVPRAAVESQYVESVQITMAESFGVEGRGRFYDQTGCVRDVVQNHLLQVLSNIAMEPPPGLDAELLRDEKAKTLKGIRPLAPGDVVRGQFRGYRDEREWPGLDGGNLRGAQARDQFVALEGRALLHPRGQVSAGDGHGVFVKLCQPPAVFTELAPPANILPLPASRPIS
jgi:glucose-6-phosphate 1-dehydrogenase